MCIIFTFIKIKKKNQEILRDRLEKAIQIFSSGEITGFHYWYMLFIIAIECKIKKNKDERIICIFYGG